MDNVLFDMYFYIGLSELIASEEGFHSKTLQFIRFCLFYNNEKSLNISLTSFQMSIYMSYDRIVYILAENLRRRKFPKTFFLG